MVFLTCQSTSATTYQHTGTANGRLIAVVRRSSASIVNGGNHCSKLGVLCTKQVSRSWTRKIVNERVCYSVKYLAQYLIPELYCKSMWHLKNNDYINNVWRICNTNTVETLYSTIYYSKYFIELNIDKSTQYVALWTHKRHPIPRPFGRAMECLLWVLQQKLIVL